MSEELKKDGRLERQRELYFIFISIIFGVFIAVWIEPVSNIFNPIGGPNNAAEVPATSGGTETSVTNFASAFQIIKAQILTKKMLIGSIMFFMLVCLWWWYAMFLGHLSPGRGFWLYLYDFVTLCSFVIAFRFWDHPIIFPIIVVIAASLMLGRFGGVLALVHEVKPRTPAHSALWLAMFVLLAFVFIGIGMVVMPYFEQGEYLENLINKWAIYQGVVIMLLFVGVLVTIIAVLITEGLPFRFPREPSYWIKERTDAKKGS